MRPKVEFYQDEGSPGEYRWRLKAGNGEVVATGEGHSSEHDAIRAFVRAQDIMYEALENWKSTDL
jgi:hypothetical protein